MADKRPDIVVNLGDTFDTHAVLRSEIKNEVMDHIQHCIKHTSQNKYYYILGNHDFYTPKSSKYHALKDWKTIANLHIIDKRFDIENITMVPYMYKYSEFPKETREICICHQTIIGASYGYTRPDAGVEAEAVSAEIMISGHVHLKQEFGKVIYPGSPFSQSVNDIDQVKGLMLFDTETYEKEFIECPLPMWIGKKFELTKDFNALNMHAELELMLGVGMGAGSDDHWVVEVSGPKAEILAYQSSNEHSELLKYFDIQFKPIFTDKEKKKVEIKGLSMGHVVGEYFNKVYKGSADKDLLIAKSLEILDKVKQRSAKAKM